MLSTISDKKESHDSSDVVDYYTAEVLSQQDYYPFGMQMPGRQFIGVSGYRYGFNGKENDNEVKGEGSQYNYGFRIYDPRIGRFLSVDPLTSNYPWYTPYQFAGNTPIQAIDLDGLEETYPGQPAKVPVLRSANVSESTCQGCAARNQAIHRTQRQLAIEKLTAEYQAWLSTPGNFGKPVPSKYVSVAMKPGPQAVLNQGGYLGSDEFKIAKARFDTYGKYLPGISDIEDGASLIKHLDEGNYKLAAMSALFLMPGGDYAKPAKDFITRLGADGIEFALKNTSRLQHAFKHAKDIKNLWEKTGIMKLAQHGNNLMMMFCELQQNRLTTYLVMIE